MSELHVKMTLLDSRVSKSCPHFCIRPIYNGGPPNEGSIKILCIAHFESPPKLCILVSARAE